MIIDQSFFKILFNFPHVFAEHPISTEKGKNLIVQQEKVNKSIGN